MQLSKPTSPNTEAIRSNSMNLYNAPDIIGPINSPIENEAESTAAEILLH